MTVTIIDKTKFHCPRCGKQKAFRPTDAGWVQRTYNDDGSHAKDEPVNQRVLMPSYSCCANPHCGARFVKDHWMPDAKQAPDKKVLGEILDGVAENCAVISYRDLSYLYNRITGFWIDHRLCWGAALMETVNEDLKANRPLRAALVINEASGHPGDGFPWATIGVISTSSQMRWNAWRSYKRKVHRFYFNHNSRPWLAKTVTHF